MYEDFPAHPYRKDRLAFQRRIKVNIDETTKNADPNYLQAIIDAIETGKPFILFYSDTQFLLAITKFRMVICFTGGNIDTQEIMGDVERFVDRVKLGMVIYDKFSTVDQWFAKFPVIKDVYLLSKK